MSQQKEENKIEWNKCRHSNLKKKEDKIRLWEKKNAN